MAGQDDGSAARTVATAALGATVLGGAARMLLPALLGPIGIVVAGAAGAATVAAVAKRSSGKAEQVARHVGELERVRSLHGEVRHLPASDEKERLLELLIENLVED